MNRKEVEERVEVLRETREALRVASIQILRQFILLSTIQCTAFGFLLWVDWRVAIAVAVIVYMGNKKQALKRAVKIHEDATKKQKNAEKKLGMPNEKDSIEA